MTYPDDDDHETYDEYLDRQAEHEEAEAERWTCAFPGRCVMPGEHMSSECATAEMMEDWAKSEAEVTR